VSTNGRSIEVRGIRVDVVRKDIKNLHVGVYPPNGRVRVAAPLRLKDDAVRLAVVTRIGWIRRQQARFEKQDRQSARELVSGETHYFRGRRYRLDLIEAEGKVGVRLRSNRRLELHIRPGSSVRRREQILNAWYRDQLRQQLGTLVAKWEPRIGAQAREWDIRRMKTRWGTCNAETKRILLNLELAKKPPACLELIVVHELVHLIERHHNERFRETLDRLLPQWRLYRDELNRAPLSHENWSY
jgi:predicted metal-dependent hydrolase